MWYLKKSPFWLQALYPQLTWHKNRSSPDLYLTFDDGPIPDVTEQVLNILQKYRVKATFFCVGDNIRKYPQIFQKLKDEGHQIGNHTFHHLKGWNTDLQTYIEDVEECHNLVQSRLFRPPHGRATKAQYRKLQAYEVIMWDVLSGDFDPNLTPETCLKNVQRHARNGSIIVFHDSLKAKERVLYALPRAIEYWLEKGYHFKTL